MNNKKLSVAIITANRKDVLNKCIESLIKSDYPIFEFFVIDNASTDGTSEMIKEKYSFIKLIQNEKNMGLSFCHNLAMKTFSGDCIFLVDDDNEVEPDMLRKLVEFLYSEKNIGITVPVILEFYDAPTKVVLAGGKTSMWSGKGILAPKTIDKNEVVRETKRVPNSTLIKREAIEAVGYMDDSLFSTLADEDYVRRLNNIGMKAVVVMKAIIYHKTNPSTATTARKLGFTNPARTYIIARNKTILICRYGNLIQKIVFLSFWQPIINSYYLYKLIFEIKNPKLTAAYLKGIWHSWKYVFTKKMPPLRYILNMTKN